VQNQMLHHIEEAGWKDLLQLQSNTGAILSKSAITIEITPWHKAGKRNCLTLLALARHAQGYSHEPSPKEAAQSTCGSHDS
jgi:hypothetical protein